MAGQLSHIVDLINAAASSSSSAPSAFNDCRQHDDWIRRSCWPLCFPKATGRRQVADTRSSRLPAPRLQSIKRLLLTFLSTVRKNSLQLRFSAETEQARAAAARRKLSPALGWREPNVRWIKIKLFHAAPNFFRGSRRQPAVSTTARANPRETRARQGAHR